MGSFGSVMADTSIDIRALLPRAGASPSGAAAGRVEQLGELPRELPTLVARETFALERRKDRASRGNREKRACKGPDVVRRHDQATANLIQKRRRFARAVDCGENGPLHSRILVEFSGSRGPAEAPGDDRQEQDVCRSHQAERD